MTDLRKEFESLMKKYGSNVYLQRRIYASNKEDSLPVDGIYALPDNPKNSYFSPTLEKYTVRHMFAGRKTALTSIAEERPEGVVHTVNRIWFFPHFAFPAEGDRVYERDLRYPDKYETYLLDYAQPFLGVNGRIEFFEAGGTREQPN